MKQAVNYQLQQLRIQQLNRSHASSYYERQENILKQQKKAYCSHKIGWEECEDQTGVPKRHKRIYSCVLYIGFWHDEFIKDIDINIEELHEEASAFGTVQKISTFPSKPPYKCAFVVFETRAETDRARVGLSEAFNELFIQKITWAQPPNCVEKTFKFDTGIGEALRLRTMTSKECNLLGHGFMRMLYGDDFVPSDIIRLCVSFYSSWFDLKIVYCDNETGDIDLKNYQIKAVSMEANHTIAHITEQIEDGIYKEAVSNEYDKLCKLSEEELKEELENEPRGNEVNPLNRRYTPSTKEVLIKCLMICKFGSRYMSYIDWRNPQFHKLRWVDYNRKRDPLVHAWLKFKQIKNIYPVKTEAITLDKELYEDEDCNKWVEVPDDYLNKMTIRQIRSLDKDFDTLVIERFNVSQWCPDRRHWSAEQQPIEKKCGSWPRQKSDDWRQKLQVGDIVEANMVNVDNYYGFYHNSHYCESVIRYVYPKDHETMAGKCVVHFIGSRERENNDEAIDIDSDRIVKRGTYCYGPSGYRNRADDTRDDRPWSDYSYEYRRRYRYDDDWYYDYLEWESEHGKELTRAGNVVETYRSDKYSRSYIAKKVQPKKKEMRKKMRNHDAKGHDKRIENKMKKYKNSYECLAY